MSLRKILQQLNIIDINDNNALANWFGRLNDYCQSIINYKKHGEKDKKIIRELSYRLQMIRRIVAADYLKALALVEKVTVTDKKPEKSIGYFLKAIKQAIKTPIYAAQTRTLDDMSSYEIPSQTLRQLEKTNKCNQPLARGKATKNHELKDTCRELRNQSYLLGVDIATPVFSSDPDEGSLYRTDVLMKFAKEQTENARVAERFARRTNANGFGFGMMHKYFSEIMSKYCKNQNIPEAHLVPDTDLSSIKIYPSGNREILYVRMVMAYKTVTLSFDDPIKSKDQKVIFYVDRLIRIAPDYETIMSIRIVPCDDDIVSSIFGFDKQDVKNACL